MASTSPHRPISSRDNRAVKFLASLSEPKVRKKERVFLIEGVKMVEEALRDKLGVKQVIASPSLTQHHGKGVIRLAEGRGVDILWISDRLMGGVAESRTPQPVMAVVEMREHGEEALIAHSSGLIVIAHQLQDPGNLGTIIRTAEAVGAAGVAITRNSVDPHNPKTVRASMGSILRMPVVKIADAQGFLGKCKKAGFQAAAMALQGDRNLFDADMTKPTAVMFGQEGSGLQGSLLESVDLRLRIPMAKTIDSLNVATSAAVVLYEALRQRMTR
jgi:TrmH family RNA methyltransferase